MNADFVKFTRIINISIWFPYIVPLMWTKAIIIIGKGSLLYAVFLWLGCVRMALDLEHVLTKRKETLTACVGLTTSCGNIFSCVRLSVSSSFLPVALRNVPGFLCFISHWRWAGILPLQCTMGSVQLNHLHCLCTGHGDQMMHHKGLDLVHSFCALIVSTSCTTRAWYMSYLFLGTLCHALVSFLGIYLSAF